MIIIIAVGDEQDYGGSGWLTEIQIQQPQKQKAQEEKGETRKHKTTGERTC